jgi:hypothetical protein
VKGVTFKKLDDIANLMTDNEAADLLQKQHKILFNNIHSTIVLLVDYS